MSSKRNILPITDEKEEFGSSGNENANSSKSENNEGLVTARGKVELNETEKMMFIDLNQDSDEANSCKNQSSEENFANPIEINELKDQKLLTPVIMRERNRYSDASEKMGTILGKRRR